MLYMLTLLYAGKVYIKYIYYIISVKIYNLPYIVKIIYSELNQQVTNIISNIIIVNVSSILYNNIINLLISRNLRDYTQRYFNYFIF